jgi:hypothetical protein
MFAFLRLSALCAFGSIPVPFLRDLLLEIRVHQCECMVDQKCSTSPLPPFFGHLLQEFFLFSTWVFVQSPQVIGIPESCGAYSGCK